VRPLTPRERKLLLLAIPAVVVVAALTYIPSTPALPAADAGAIAVAQQRLAGLRMLKSLVPAREAVMKQISADVAARERGMIPGDTAAQAQAALLEALRRVGKADQLDIRGGEFPPPKPFGDYAMVFTTINFECHVEQLVNYVADLGRQPELMAPFEERITAGADKKQKIVLVRMIVAGVAPRKLIPEKKGLGGY
jgi:hypothetical protein